MAQIPSFLTGANAKVKAGAITIAYAQDVSYSTTVTTIPVETMGRYEVVSNEPVAYFIDGSLSIVRYTSVAKDNNMPDANEGGNGLGKWKPGGDAPSTQSNAINPANILQSQTFDLEVFQKTSSGSGGSDPVSAFKIKNVRFTRKGAGISKRGILVDSFAFNAILADDDSFQSGPSGDPDLQ